MTESQNLEWKSSWRDEYLKWICGFANAQGGTLVIGKNDRGEIVGVKDPLRLLEEIPNKTQSLLGIVVDVDLKSEEGGEYLEIKVDPYPHPVSYKGEYHYRSGSTRQVLRGGSAEPVPAPQTRPQLGRRAGAGRSAGGPGRENAGRVSSARHGQRPASVRHSERVRQ